MRALELPRRNDDPDFAAGSVHFVGTATIILRYAGFTILPDPNFLHSGTHPHLGYGLTARRLTDPAVEMDDLPPIDLVVLSHLHGDLFDRVVERRLNRGTPIISTGHAVRYLKRKGFTATHAMNTWESMEVIKGEARTLLSAMPGTHAPGPLERILPPVMGSMLEFRREDVRLPLYITGDTLIHERLQEIPRRFPGVDLALLHLGGTRVPGVLVTMDADQGVQMLRIVDPKEAIPVHYNDYTVFKSPLEDFRRAVEASGFGDRIRWPGTW